MLVRAEPAGGSGGLQGAGEGGEIAVGHELGCGDGRERPAEEPFDRGEGGVLVRRVPGHDTNMVARAGVSGGGMIGCSRACPGWWLCFGVACALEGPGGAAGASTLEAAMPMYSFEWLKYPLAFHTDLVNFADEVLAWRMVCVAAYQMNNIPPLRDGPGLWVACGRPRDYATADQEVLLAHLDDLGQGMVGFKWVQKLKQAAVLMSEQKAAAGKRSGEVRRGVSRDVQHRDFLVRERTGVRTPVEQVFPDAAPPRTGVQRMFEQPLNERRTENATRAPAPALPALSVPVAGGVHDAGGTPEPVPPVAGSLPLPQPPRGPSSQRAYHCAGCGVDRGMVTPANALTWPCPVCGGSMDLAVAAMKGGPNVEVARGRDRVSVPRLPGPRGAVAEPRPREDAAVRPVQAAHAAAVRPGAKPKKKASQKALGRVAAKRDSPQHGGNVRRGAPDGRTRRK